MRVLQINTVYQNGGSTGRIVHDLLTLQMSHGIEGFAAYGYDTNNQRTKNVLGLQGQIRRKVNILRTRIYDMHGFYNEYETRKLIKWMDKIHPDIIHLHNLHNHYIHVGMLFEYIKSHHIPVIWTLHDCWPMTGHCAHFDYIGCEKWKCGCRHCPSLKEYPPTWFIDRTRQNYARKKATFQNVESLMLVTPSKWLANLTRESFLSHYPVCVINNGIDTTIFHPQENDDLRIRMGLRDKSILLYVANVVNERKGINSLLEIREKLSDDERLVIVGTDSRAQRLLESGKCICIKRTDSIQELAAYYNMANVFINPTLEDNFPTTNLEALACGTPVVTYRTGGSVESVDEKSGRIVEKEDAEGMLEAARAIIRQGKERYRNYCAEKANRLYNKSVQFEKYIELYQKIHTEESGKQT